MALRKNLTGEIASIKSLSQAQISEMYDLMNAYYENVNPFQFKKDIYEKRDV